jgi:endonuclease III
LENKPAIKQILERLVEAYGHRDHIPHHDPIAELVQTILSQNTSDLNSRPAFKSLMISFTTWENIIRADPLLVADSIKSGGLAQIKASRIQQALTLIKQKRGTLDLNFLENLPLSDAREWLLQLPGVGNKTANCVLLFALGRPALPVDTHVFRLSRRLGLLPASASLDEANRLLEPMVPQNDIYEFHVLMIEHGRRVCIARSPHCSLCILNSLCPGAAVFQISSKYSQAGQK